MKVRALTCAACGARNHAGWRQCQRCRADLSPATSVPSGARRGVPVGLLAGGAALVALVTGLVLLSSGPKPAQSSSVATRGPGNPSLPTEADARRPGATGETGDEAMLTPVTPDDFARAGGAAYAQGRLDVALSAFQAAVEAHPGDAEARNNLGQVLVRQGQVADALPHFEAAVAADPDKWAFRFNLARARGQAGDWAGAVEDYRAAEGLFPDDHVTPFNLGKALQALGRHADAAQALERAVSLEPDEPSLLLPLAYSYEHLSRWPQALEAYRTFLDRRPDAADATAIRARVAQLERAPSSAGAAEPVAAAPPGA